MNTSRMESTTTDTAADLNPPHGGRLVDLMVGPERAAELKAASRDWPSWDLTPRQVCDLELLLNGGFSPLVGFMGQADYDSVCASMRLSGGALWTMPITLDVTRGAGGTAAAGIIARAAGRRGRHAGRAARGGRLAARPREGGPGGLRHHQPGAPRRGLPAGPVASLLRGRAAGRPAPALALRLPEPAAHACRAARRVRAAGLDEDRRLPDPEPHASRAPGADPARRARGGRPPGHPAGGGDDQARRPRPLHARALLPGAARPLPGGHGQAGPAPPGHAHGGPAGGRVARHHPEELRLHPPHRRARPRGAGQRQERQTLLRALRRPGAPAPARGGAGRAHGGLQDDRVRQGAGHLRARERGASRRHRPQHLGHRAAPPPGRRGRDPRVVHLPGRGPRAAPDAPPARQAGLHRLLHRPLRLGQVHHRQRPASSSSWSWAGGR